MSAPPVLRPLGVGELLDNAINVYRKNFVTLVGIGAVMAVPTMLVQSTTAFFESPSHLYGLLGGAFSPLGEPAKNLMGDLAKNLPALAFWYLFTNGLSALFGLAVIVVQVGAFAFAVSEERLGRRVTIGGAYRHALRRWISLLISAILIQLAVLAAFIPLYLALDQLGRSGYFSRETPGLLYTLPFLVAIYVPLIFPSVVWSLTTPAIVLENLGVFKGMGQSWRLVGKSFWRTGAVLLVAGALVNFLTCDVFVAVQYAARTLPYPFPQTVVTSAGGLVAGTIVEPLAYVALTLLYYDLRVRHEGYDLQVALEQLKQSTPEVATEAPA